MHQYCLFKLKVSVKIFLILTSFSSLITLNKLEALPRFVSSAIEENGVIAAAIPISKNLVAGDAFAKRCQLTDNQVSADYRFCLQDDPLEMVEYLVPLSDDLHSVSGIAGIDRIYCINLNRRAERYRKCKRLFEKYNLFVNRFPAIDGWQCKFESRKLFGHYKIPILNQFNTDCIHISWTPGQIGCALSHLSILQSAYQSELESVWIIEDDVKFSENPHKLGPILEKLNEIDPDWDIYYTDPDSFFPRNYESCWLRPERLGGAYKGPRERQYIDNEIMVTGFRFGNYSYICSRKGMKKILDHFTKAYWYQFYDIEIHLIEGLRSYSSPRNIVTFAQFEESDTQHKLLPNR